MTLLIRPYRTTDDQVIADLIVPIQREEFGLSVTLVDQPDLADITGFYCQGRGGFWVAELDGRIVGSIALIDIGNGQSALRKMFVARAARGADMGAALKLLNTVIDHANQNNISAIYLGTTTAFLAAHKFYEKNNFVHINESQLPSSFPKMVVDSRFYCRMI